MSHYKHLTIEERESLYLRKNQGESIRSIAKVLGRAPSTLSRELRRNEPSHRPYSPSAAQRRYEKNKKHCGRKAILADEAHRDLIRDLIGNREWSPEQIENRLALEGNAFQISFATIYRALSNGLLDGGSLWHVRKCDRYCFHLRRKGKPRKKNGKKNQQGTVHPVYIIAQRPVAANERSELGHWEGDTMAGMRGGAHLLTQVDRRARYLLAAKVPDNTAKTVSNAMIQMFHPLPEEKVRSITPDRGHEFSDHAKVTKALHQVPFYFADPHSPWQRGTNENTNGLLRQYFPKHTSLDSITQDELASVVDKLNLRPRKCLGWLSPYEVFFDTLLHLT